MPTLSASSYKTPVAAILNFRREMTKAHTVADLRDYAGSGEPVTLTVTPSSLDAMLMLKPDQSPSPSSAHNSSAYDPSDRTPPTTRCDDGTNRTESDLSATATVRCPEAAENASIKKNSPAAQALCDESPPSDKLDSNLLQQFDDRTLDDLLKERRALRRVLASALASAEFFFDFQPSPLEIAKIEPLSDEEIAALETEIIGSGDIEAPRLDPIPSLPFSNGTTIDVVPALSISEAVPAATTESSASGGAVRRILDVRTDPTLGSGDMAGSFVYRPAPDLPTISVGKITAFRLCCEAGFQPDVQATVRPPEQSSRTNLWQERIRERSAGAERTGREQHAQAKLRRMNILDKAGLYQQLRCVRRANTTLSPHLSNLQVGAYWAESCQQVICRLAGGSPRRTFRRLSDLFRVVARLR